jgi:UDP-2,4-diacetamido-2,4,6-trideoxy-beta-L-altropyranose hydrolase
VSEAPALFLRPIDSQDIRDLFAWRNDPETLRNSKTTEPVAWADHERWFAASIGRGDRVMYMALSGDEKAGTVRFDRLMPGNGAWLASITMNPAFRGRGLGASLLAEACSALARHYDVSSIDAEIRLSNLASQRVFQANGFSFVGNLALEGFQLFRRSFIVSQTSN